MFGCGLRISAMAYYKHLDHSKIQYDFFLSEWEAKAFRQEITDLGGRVFVVPAITRYNLISPNKQLEYHRTLYRYFTQNQYPLVYAHMNAISVFPLFAAKRAGIPIRIAHSHTTASIHDDFGRNVMKNFLRMFSRVFPTHMCACSKLAGEWLYGKRVVNSGRVLVWPNAIELERFAYNPQMRTDIRRELGLEGKFVVGHAGVFTPQKNHDFLIDIFAEICRLRDDAVLMLISGGRLRNAIEQKVHRLGLEEKVMFVGFTREIEKYYQAMDVFVFPSIFEGLGMVTVEAQVAGLPVLCSTEVPEEAKVCENLHFMSLKKSAREWAEEALRISHGHVRRDMSQYARAAGFDIKQQAQNLTQWYCELLGL